MHAEIVPALPATILFMTGIKPSNHQIKPAWNPEVINPDILSSKIVIEQVLKHPNARVKIAHRTPAATSDRPAVDHPDFQEPTAQKPDHPQRSCFVPLGVLLMKFTLAVERHNVAVDPSE